MFDLAIWPAYIATIGLYFVWGYYEERRTRGKKGLLAWIRCQVLPLLPHLFVVYLVAVNFTYWRFALMIVLYIASVSIVERISYRLVFGRS